MEKLVASAGSESPIGKRDASEKWTPPRHQTRRPGGLKKYLRLTRQHARLRARCVLRAWLKTLNQPNRKTATPSSAFLFAICRHTSNVATYRCMKAVSASESIGRPTRDRSFKTSRSQNWPPVK